MSKQVKKRNKPYRGADAATGPRVTRYTVGNENAVTSWWKENKRANLGRLILLGLAMFIGWILYVVVY